MARTFRFRKLRISIYEPAPAQVSHENGARRIYVGFNVKGRDVQSTVEDIQEILDEKLKLPEGYYYNYGGEFENLQSASRRLMVVVPIALVIILLLLYATVKNVSESLFVFSAIPLAAIGGVWALWLRGMPFSISAGVGFIALFGVAVLNGIVLIGQMNQMQKEQLQLPPAAGTNAGEMIHRRIIDSCMLRLASCPYDGFGGFHGIPPDGTLAGRWCRGAATTCHGGDWRTHHEHPCSPSGVCLPSTRHLPSVRTWTISRRFL